MSAPSSAGVISSRTQFHDSWSTMVGPVVGNTFEVACVVTLLPLLVGPGASIRRTRRAMGALGIMLVAAGAGGAFAALVDSSAVIGRDLGSWGRWTLGDFTGMAILLPLVYAARADWLGPHGRRGIGELVGTAALTIALIVISFTVLGPVAPLAITFVVWLALRFGPVVSAPMVAVIALTTSRLTVAGAGPFSSLGGDVVVNVQWFNLAVASGAFVVSTFSTRAWDDEQQLIATLRSLPDLVVVRDSSSGQVDRWGNTALAEQLGELPASVEPGVSVVIGASGETIERRATRTTSRRTLEVYRDVSAERSLRRLRRELEARVETSRDETRADFAQQLHDGPLQAIVAARMFLSAKDAGAGGNGSPERSATVERLLSDAIEGLRGVLLGLEAESPERGSLVDAVNEFGRRLFGGSGVAFLPADPDPSVRGLLPTGDSAAEVYAIAREALLNAALHSQCAGVDVVFGGDRGRWSMTVTDDGIGVPSNVLRARGHLGLVGMHARAEQLGAELEVRRATAAGGTVVTLSADAGDDATGAVDASTGQLIGRSS